MARTLQVRTFVNLHRRIDVAQRGERLRFEACADQIGIGSGQPGPRRRRPVAEGEAIAQRLLLETSNQVCQSGPAGIARA